MGEIKFYNNLRLNAPIGYRISMFSDANFQQTLVKSPTMGKIEYPRELLSIYFNISGKLLENLLSDQVLMVGYGV